jgi:hypothetical protein
MTVVCSWCRKECEGYEFRVNHGVVSPVCIVCIQSKELKEEEMIDTINDLENSFLDEKQNSLNRWVK